MPPKSTVLNDTYSEAETAARAETALKRMLATPHKPHTASHIKKRAAKKVRPTGGLD